MKCRGKETSEVPKPSESIDGSQCSWFSLTQQDYSFTEVCGEEIKMKKLTLVEILTLDCSLHTFSFPSNIHYKY